MDRYAGSIMTTLRALSIQFTLIAAVGANAHAGGDICANLFNDVETASALKLDASLVRLVQESTLGGGMKAALFSVERKANRREIIGDEKEFRRASPEQVATLGTTTLAIETLPTNRWIQRLVVRRDGSSEPEILKTYSGGYAQLVQTQNGTFVFFGHMTGRSEMSVERISIGKKKEIAINSLAEVFNALSDSSKLHVVGNFVVKLTGNTIRVYHPTATGIQVNYQATYLPELSGALSTELRIVKVNDNGDLDVQITALFPAVTGPVYSPRIELTRVTSDLTLKVTAR